MSGLKEFLTDGSLSTHSWARDYAMSDLVGVVMRRLKREADRAVGGSNVRNVVLGHPVRFQAPRAQASSVRQDAAKRLLEEAAQAAGFENWALFPEPAAALMDEEIVEGRVLALDFGGGTFDAAIVRYRPDGGTVVALQGADVGGELFNGELFQAKVTPAVGLDHNGIPAYIRNSLKTMAGARFLMSDSNFLAAIQSVPVIREVFSGGHVFHLYRAVEDAKIRLSTEQEATIGLHRPGIDLEIPSLGASLRWT